MDNLTDRIHAGSVIVNELNRRSYEPAPQRSVTLGLQASFRCELLIFCVREFILRPGRNDMREEP